MQNKAISSQKLDDHLKKKKLNTKNFGVSFFKIRQANFDIWDHFYYKVKFRNFHLIPIQFKGYNSIRKLPFDNVNYLQTQQAFFRRNIVRRLRFRYFRIKAFKFLKRKAFNSYKQLKPKVLLTKLSYRKRMPLKRLKFINRQKYFQWISSKKWFKFSRFFRIFLNKKQKIKKQQFLIQKRRIGKRIKISLFKIFRRLQPNFSNFKLKENFHKLFSHPDLLNHHLGISTILSSLFVNFGHPTIKFILKRVGKRDKRFLQMIPWSVRFEKRIFRGIRFSYHEFRRRKDLTIFGILVGRSPKPRRKKNKIATIKFYRKIFSFFFGNLREKRLHLLFKKIRRYNYRRSFIGLIEKRLDFLLLRSSFVRNLFVAGQAIRRGEFLVNGRRVIRANHKVKPYDIISISKEYFKEYRDNFLRKVYLEMVKYNLPPYLEVNYKLLNIVFVPFVYNRRFFYEKSKLFTKKIPYRSL